VSAGAVVPDDEHRHLLSPAVGWEERWWFDFAAGGGSIGGYLQVVYRPSERAAWVWAALVGHGRPLLAVRAHDVRIPKRGTEVRSDGIWACVVCETPLEHWSVGLETFAVALDDPLDAWRGERGNPVPFGLDLEWEALLRPERQPRPCPDVDPPPTDGQADGYGQWCRVTGEVLVGTERVDLHALGAVGHREHAWGPGAGSVARRAPGAGPVPGERAWRAAGGTGTGAWWAAGTAGGGPGSAPADGWVVWDGLDPEPARLWTRWGGTGVPVAATLEAAGIGPVELRPAHLSPVAVPGAPVVHALCRATAADGTTGCAWVTWDGLDPA